LNKASKNLWAKNYAKFFTILLLSPDFIAHNIFATFYYQKFEIIVKFGFFDTEIDMVAKNSVMFAFSCKLWID
jgi:hypothetical protein